MNRDGFNFTFVRFAALVLQENGAAHWKIRVK
jgi:hypothetical protein